MYMEIVDVVDKRGIPTGEQVEREQAHTLGIRHRTSHVWIVRRKEGRLQVLLQKRSENKDSFPGCYDISSAGHIPAGVDFVSSAVRELKEELGCEVKPEELIYCGQRCFEFQDTFHGKVFHDNQVSNVYALWLDREPETFSLQKEEVSEVKWFDFQECMEKVEKNEIPNCIFTEELTKTGIPETLIEIFRHACFRLKGDYFSFLLKSFFVSFLTFFLHFPQAFPALVAFFTSLKEAAPSSTARATSPLETL